MKALVNERKRSIPIKHVRESIIRRNEEFIIWRNEGEKPCIRENKNNEGTITRIMCKTIPDIDFLISMTARFKTFAGIKYKPSIKYSSN